MLRRFAVLLLLSICLVTLSQLDVAPRILAQQKAPFIPPYPQAPTVAPLAPYGFQKGKSVEVMIAGTNLTDPLAILLSCPGKATIAGEMNNGKDATKFKAKFDFPADTPMGIHTMRVVTKSGISNARLFCIDDVPTIEENNDNKTLAKPQAVTIPCAIAGKIAAETSQFFKFSVNSGQSLNVETIARRLGGPLDPIIRLYDAKTSRELPIPYSDDEPGLQSDARITHTFKADTEVIVEIRDSRHEGGAESIFRLRITEGPAAMLPLPVAIQRSKTAQIGFASRGPDKLNPVSVKAPTGNETVTFVQPQSSKGALGWPVALIVSDFEEILEQEPNNEPAKANRLPVPGGVTGVFQEKKDKDCFVFAGKKGVKYSITAETYEILSPADVILTVQDSMGKALGKSNETMTPARVEITPTADGDVTIIAEHTNYLFGPTEVYRLTVQPSSDFGVNLGTDRLVMAPNSTTILPITSITRRDYTGPIELSVSGKGFSGSVTIQNVPNPADGKPIALLPIKADSSITPGGYSFEVKAKGTIDGKEVIRLGRASEIWSTQLSGLPFPPQQFLSTVSVAVVDKPPFTLTVKGPDSVNKGGNAELTITTTRAEGFAEDIVLAGLGLPANVTLAPKPIAKGTNEIKFPINATPAAANGKFWLVIRGTAKVAGKDTAWLSNAIEIEVKGELKK